MVSHHHGVVRDTTEFALLRMVGVLASIFPLAALIQVLANLHAYRQPAVAVAVWLAMFPVGLWLVPRLRTDGLTKSESAAAILIALAVVAVIGWEHRPHLAIGRVDLAVLGTAWLLALVTLSNPPWVWVPGALSVFASHAALLVHAIGANRLSLTQLEAAGYILVASLCAFAALRPTIALHTRIAARRALLASRSEAEQAAAAAVQEDRRHRLALLEAEALPLLRAIADGTLSPAADGVRQRCAQHASALRHSLTDRAPVTGGLMAALEPALTAGRARGLLVDTRVIGDPGAQIPQVARAVVATVEAVLSGLPPQQITLTVLAPGDDVELYLTFAGPAGSLPDVARDVPAAARWRAVLTAGETGTALLEMTWKSGKGVLRDRRH
ncbi:MAG TPA: hypothetical protein VFB06_01065 [Streptosporangiaceae bacterium]|nr:hypothetical protein [Streptosporangiaceae bacterium]